MALGLLRFLGLFNAAVWFGTIGFQLFISGPVMSSVAIRQLLGPKSFPYFSAAIRQVLSNRCYTWFLICSLIALLHIGAEWLYSGKNPKRGGLILVFALFLCGELQSRIIQPKLEVLLLQQYRPGPATEAARAASASRPWRAVSITIELLLLIGLSRYLWQVANPPQQTRFIGSAP